MRPFFCAKNGMAHECARHIIGLLMVFLNGILDNYELTVYIYIYYIYRDYIYIYNIGIQAHNQSYSITINFNPWVP